MLFMINIMNKFKIYKYFLNFKFLSYIKKKYFKIFFFPSILYTILL